MTSGARPTLKTIAELAGLSIPTVSRALSGAEDIGLKTRKRVRKIADDIGYIPNRAGVRLRTGRTHVISLVFSTEADVMNVSAGLINSVAAALRKTSYHLTITPYFPSEDTMGPIRHLVETHAADAVIINKVQPEDERVKYLLEKKFPFATHGRSNWANAHAYYDFDNQLFASQAMRALAQRGRKSIGLLAPPQNQNESTELIKGAVNAAHEAGLTLNIIEDLNSDDSCEKIESYMATTTIDGLICASANACMAAVTGVEKAGKVVGKDIDFFSKEPIPVLKRFRSSILAQHEDAWIAGEFLTRAVIERIEKPDDPLMQFLEFPERSD